MTEGESGAARLADMLRHADDLDKISGLKADIIRKKAAVDAQLKVGLKEQLDITQSGMSAIGDSQKTLELIKEEMIKIDRLCAEAQSMIKNFPEINAVAQAHRNFAQVEAMKDNVERFNERLDGLELLLQDDETDLETQPNLLRIHHGLTQLRNVRDDAMDQVKRSSDRSLEETLLDHFKRLDDVIDVFDQHVGMACMNLIDLVQSENISLVVRLAVIVEEEEKFDRRIKALQDAQRDHKELASRFKSIKSGPKELRGYKEKFLQAIEQRAQDQISAAYGLFLDDPEKLEKSLRWFFNDLNTVKLGMIKLMPRKWKIYKVYVTIYHRVMHEWLTACTKDDNLRPPHMLAIIHWKDKYYTKMKKLGVAQQDLQPSLLDGRDIELVREYRQLIVKSVDEWMNRMFSTDKQSFIDRKEGTLDYDEHRKFRTKTLGDMWRMLGEQLLVAGTSGLPEVAEGVVDAMFRALKTRQDNWHTLVNAEFDRCTGPQSDPESLQGLQDWLVAIANDHIACIDDDAEQGSYFSNFKMEYEPLVSAEFIDAATIKFESLSHGYVDLATHCLLVFQKLIFAVDFKTILGEFFTPAWYSSRAMGQIISTFEDYLGDYADVMHESLHGILIEELAKDLLVHYLTCVRNKGARFRRTDPYNNKIKDDVQTVFAFFEKHPDSYPGIKEEWRVIADFTGLLEAEKHTLPAVCDQFVQTYWDVRLGWIEAVLRARDDIEWGPFGDGKTMLNGIKSRFAENRFERGLETIMAKVK